MTGASTVVKTFPIHSLVKRSAEDKRPRCINVSPHVNIPVTVNVAGVYVVRSLQASDWLETHTGGLVGHDVNEPILEFVAGEVGCDKAGRVGFGVGQSLRREDEYEF